MEAEGELTSLHSDDAALHFWKGKFCILASNNNVAV